MRIALDKEGTRISPSYSGQKAFCPICNGLVIGKCGEIYIRHWQHVVDKMCDPWQEHETDWHRRWKQFFPFDWQEVTINNVQEKHRADIRTSNGLVIEFQNSSISTYDIQIREQFYGDMIWVVNAETFKKNFKIRSLVSSDLNRLDAHYDQKEAEIIAIYNKDQKEIELKIKRINDQIQSEQSNLENENYKLKCLLSEHGSLDGLVDQMMQSWGSKFPFKMYIFKLEEQLEPQKEKLKKIRKDLDALEKLKESMQNQLDRINSLENIEVEGTILKAVQFDQLPKDSLDIISIITKMTLGSFFLDVRKVTTLQELNSFQYKQTEFTFCVDPTTTILKIKNEIINIDNNILLLKNDVITIGQAIREASNLWFANEIRLAKSKIKLTETKLQDLSAQHKIAQKKKMDFEIQVIKDLEEIKKADKKEKEKRRSSIMKSRKGFYTYDWSHERTTWQEASKRLLFDFGNGFLFERVEENVFKKISHTEFLKEFLPVTFNISVSGIPQ